MFQGSARTIRPIDAYLFIGNNLHDHPLLSNVYEVNATGTVTTDDLSQNSSFADVELDLWTNKKQGFYTMAISNHIGWFRLPDNSSILKTETDFAAGPTSSHYEFLIFVSLVIYSCDTRLQFVPLTERLRKPLRRECVVWTLPLYDYRSNITIVS